MMPYLCSSNPTDVPRANTRMSHASAICRPGAECEAAHRGDRGIARFFQPRVRLLRTQDAVDGGIVMTRPDVGRRLRFASVEPPREHRRVDARRKGAAVADHDQRAQVGSSRSSLPSARSSCHIWIVNELSFSGRFSRNQPTWPSRVNSTVSYSVMCERYRRRRRNRSGRPRPARGYPATVIIPAGSIGRAVGCVRGELDGGENLVGLRRAREAGREVHGASGVVVALEQDHRAARTTGVHRQRQLELVRQQLELGHRADRAAQDRPTRACSRRRATWRCARRSRSRPDAPRRGTP